MPRWALLLLLQAMKSEILTKLTEPTVATCCWLVVMLVLPKKKSMK